MARVNHKRVKQLLNEKRSKITDKQFFTSRILAGFYGEKDRPKGGHYMNGYRHAGYFFVWIRDNYDADFLRKFNQSTLHVVPWSFDGAIKSILGEEYDIESLWHEYQVAVGDIKE